MFYRLLFLSLSLLRSYSSPQPRQRPQRVLVLVLVLTYLLIFIHRRLCGDLFFERSSEGVFVLADVYFSKSSLLFFVLLLLLLLLLLLFVLQFLFPSKVVMNTFSSLPLERLSTRTRVRKRTVSPRSLVRISNTCFHRSERRVNSSPLFSNTSSFNSFKRCLSRSIFSISFRLLTSSTSAA